MELNKTLYAIAISTAATALVFVFSQPLSASYAQLEAQDDCPFYFPNCQITRNADVTEESLVENVSAIVNTATIEILERSTHFDILTGKMNGTLSDISEEVITQINDIEHNEELLFLVDRINNETLEASDFEALEEQIASRLQDGLAESIRTSPPQSEKTLNISILRLVNASSDMPSSLTVDIHWLNPGDSNQSPLYGHSIVNEAEYPAYAACWMGYLIGNGMNTTLAIDAQEVCLKT